VGVNTDRVRTGKDRVPPIKPGDIGREPQGPADITRLAY